MNIEDSGDRTEFGTGAVRDVRKGKGRMDLLPMRALYEIGRKSSGFDSEYEESMTCGMSSIFLYMCDPNPPDGKYLIKACWHFMCALDMHSCNEQSGHYPTGSSLNLPPNSVIEVAKVLEVGSEKYAPRNWENGIPLSRFIDSGLRHVFRHLRGDDNEPHLAMACWNFLCCLDTILRIKDGILSSDLNDLPTYSRYVAIEKGNEEIS